MPTGLAIAVAIATPVLAFFGVLVANWITRRGAKELDTWRRREETMRLLRWAVESAASDKPVLAVAGLAVLEELIDAEILQPEDQRMVGAVVEIVTSAAASMAYADHSELDYADPQTMLEPEEGSDV